jgi:hypothetical protein
LDSTALKPGHRKKRVDAMIKKIKYRYQAGNVFWRVGNTAWLDLNVKST